MRHTTRTSTSISLVITALILMASGIAKVDGDTIVYAGGYSSDSVGVAAAGYWRNGAWVGLPPLDKRHHSYVASLVVLGTDVYAGGGSWDSQGIPVAGYWKNGTWVGLPSLDEWRDSKPERWLFSAGLCTTA